MGQKIKLAFQFQIIVLTFYSVCARRVLCYCASSTQFLKTIIFQGSV